MIYSSGNAAKQWIFEELDRQFDQRAFQALDLGCGTAKIWQAFLDAHPNASLYGVDIDSRAIEEGKKRFANQSRVRLELFDAQHQVSEPSSDVVVALSAIEHVVDRPAFLKTVWFALRPGGVAYLNYDVGHFRSHDVKERLMVPVSQLLALIGIQGSYMKKVNDHLFAQQAMNQGFRILQTRKHNLASLKGFIGSKGEEALKEWYAFEDRLNQRFSPEELDGILWSTTLVLQKP